MVVARSVDARVIAAVRAWAAAGVEGAAMLAEQRRALDPLLLPQLVAEVAEITAEQLVVVLDRPPSRPPRKDERPVPFLGVELSQEQGRRAAAWLDEQAELAQALALSSEQWSARLTEGMRRVLERLRGKPLSLTTSQLASTLAGGALAEGARAEGALASAARGFQGGADPRVSDQAGLRGLLSARGFLGKKP